MLPSWTGPAIALGPWLQLYLGSMKPADVTAMVLEAKRLKLPGVIFHAGPRSLVRAAPNCAGLARAHDIAFAWAIGADGEEDSDGSRLTVEEKADCLADVCERFAPAFAVVNAESQWDSDKGDDDDMDESGALRMGARFRARCPRVLVIDQPWFAMDSHGEERKIAKPLGQGGTFAGFPSDEFASWVDARAPQVYFRNFGSGDPTAYARVVAWHERDWAKHDASLERLGLVRPRTYTLQAYGHHLRPQDFVDALLSLRDRASVLWWDHEFIARWPVTAACIEAVNRIVRGGHAPPGRESRDCVRSWQRALGLDGAQLDGLCGWGTIERAGIARRA